MVSASNYTINIYMCRTVCDQRAIATWSPLVFCFITADCNQPIPNIVGDYSSNIFYGFYNVSSIMLRVILWHPKCSLLNAAKYDSII